MKAFITPFMLVLVLVPLLGCSTAAVYRGPDSPPTSGEPMINTPASPSALTHVLTSDTPYYTQGPQQARPPNGTLTAGTLVAVIEDQGSYTVIQTKEGVVGHVASGALAPRE